MGTYSISVSDTDGVSSSFVMDDEGKVLTISNDPSFYHLDWTENCPRKNCRNNQTIYSLLCIKKKQDNSTDFMWLVIFLIIAIMKIGIS